MNRLGFAAINAELIDGVPQQTAESFRRTIAQVAELRPTRIALCAYAHLPQRFKPQHRIDAAALRGVTAIGRVGMRGLALSRGDLLRRAVIMVLMCQGRVGFASIESAHLMKTRVTFADELEPPKPLQRPGLVAVNDTEIQITQTGWFFVRAMAVVFGRHRQAGRRARERCSRVI